MKYNSYLQLHNNFIVISSVIWYEGGTNGSILCMNCMNSSIVKGHKCMAESILLKDIVQYSTDNLCHCQLCYCQLCFCQLYHYELCHYQKCHCQLRHSPPNCVTANVVIPTMSWVIFNVTTTMSLSTKSLQIMLPPT